MTGKAYTNQEERIARFAKAMGHPARIAILRFLAAQPSLAPNTVQILSGVFLCLQGKSGSDIRAAFSFV